MTNLSNWCLNYNTLSMIHVLRIFNMFILLLRTLNYIYFGRVFRQPHFLTWRVVKKKRKKNKENKVDNRWQRRLARVGLLARVTGSGSSKEFRRDLQSSFKRYTLRYKLLCFTNFVQNQTIHTKRFPMHQFGFKGFKNKVLQRSYVKISYKYYFLFVRTFGLFCWSKLLI